MNLKDLTSLIALGESETLEFKESFGDETLETIGSFSNARGGIILVGVKDSSEICGFNCGKSNLEEFANRIQNITDPRLQPSLLNFQYENKNIIVIQVQARTGAPISVRGRYFRRVGRTNQRMSHEEIMQGMISSNGLSWDAFLESSASLDDLDLDRISRFINIVKKIGRRPITEQVTDLEFLRKIGLIQDVVPTRAALLLFGKNPERFFSSAFLKLGRFRVVFFKQLVIENPVIRQDLSERQLLALKYVKEHGSISNTEYQGVAKISQRTATRELNELKSKNILVSTGGRTGGKGGGRGFVYRLKE